jgi:uncharacterized protein with von Willebrand factor type A (vWA) domain
MRERLLGFVDALRSAGVTPNVAETLDASRAVAAAGVERSVLREALAATLVKDHAERPAFDDVFDRYFGVPPRVERKREKGKQIREGEGQGGEGEGAGRAPRREGAGREGDEKREKAERGEESRARRSAERLARERALLSRPFREMDPREVEELEALVAELGRRFRRRWSRRMRRASHGRLDVRRTIRRALSRGGVPIELLLRESRPGKVDLVALVDLSHSTATAAEFLLALLAPARSFFRRVRLFGYVDAPAEVSIENGHLVPHQPLDLGARSDFGKVLRLLDERHRFALGRNTVLLVLGDARNNRLPPRADLLARMRREVRSVVWLDPEPRERWDTGDSVIGAYARSIDLLLAAPDPRSLMAALDRLVKKSS